MVPYTITVHTTAVQHWDRWQGEEKGGNFDRGVLYVFMRSIRYVLCSQNDFSKRWDASFALSILILFLSKRLGGGWIPRGTAVDSFSIPSGSHVPGSSP